MLYLSKYIMKGDIASIFLFFKVFLYQVKILYLYLYSIVS
jgi:hypothetical protein